MAITGKNPENFELFFVTHNSNSLSTNDEWTAIYSLKELQSDVQRWNTISKIEKAIITKGEEVDVEYIKPRKYKGKPYKYQEKYSRNKEEK